MCVPSSSIFAHLAIHPPAQEDIFLTDGASPAVHYCMKCLLRDKNDSILTPIPQYPLYSATISLYGASRIAPQPALWLRP